MPNLPPALRHPDYRVFWTGQALSAFGSQFTTVAMAWQIYELTNSPLQLDIPMAELRKWMVEEEGTGVGDFGW